MTGWLPLAAEALRFFVALTLAAAVVGKLRNPAAFAVSVAELFHAGPVLAQRLAWAVIAGEAGAAGLLVAGGDWAKAGAAGALALVLAFGAVIATVLAERRTVNCSCFGEGEGHAISPVDLARNGLLAVACIAQLVVAPAAPAGLAAHALLLAAGGLLALATVKLHRLLPRRPARGALPAGAALPPFEGVAERDGRPVTQADLAGQAAVLLFMASGCPKCRGHVPELAGLLPAVRAAGVGLWIVPMESGPSPLLAASPLADHELRLAPALRSRLNPERATPHYLFVDHLGVVQASGLIGDADWRSFTAQLAEIDEAA